MNSPSTVLRSLVGAVALSWASASMALVLGPGDADETSSQVSALSAADVASIFNTSDLTLLYKRDFDSPSLESGAYADFYSTLFGGFDEDNEPHAATITWDGPDYLLCPECYLVVKNGKQPQYLFDLATWDGMETLDLQNFYPRKGAISHVAIFGKPTVVQVTEPGTLGLMGIGLLGFLVLRRRLASHT